MAETAKKVAEEKPAAKKGRARKTKEKKPTKAEQQKANEQLEAAFSEADNSEQPVDSIREQIENCKNELVEAVTQEIRMEYRLIVEKQVAKANRRRRWSNFFHDLVILLLAVTVGYFGYCLYDARYFDFMKSECERNNTCETSDNTEITEGAGPVKDATWYLANYSYLYEQIQTNLSAENISAYYLYTNDHKVEQIRPEYLLSMAYNQLDLAYTPEASEIEIPEAAMQKAFEETFGNAELFETVDFEYDCLKFKFDKSSKSFKTKRELCAHDSSRKIIEQIERIYEEGEVLYMLTTAVVFDSAENTLYSLDDLFQPLALNISESSLGLYTTLFNRYQYQFKKQNDDQYHLASIVKLR